MITRGASALFIGLAATSCASPRAVPEVAVIAPVQMEVEALPGLVAPMVPMSWEVLVSDPSIESVDVFWCGGVVMSDDLASYQVWQVNAVIERRERNAIEAMYRLPPRDLPVRVFELKRTK